MTEPLYLGVGRRIISPEVGCNLAGYFPDVISTSLHDDLTATAFYFQCQDIQAMMVSVTVCSLRAPLCDKLREEIEQATGVPRDNCIIHAVHTHSGPITGGGPGWGDFNAEYCEDVLIPGVLGAAREAVKNPTPVKMKVSVGESLIGVNRRELTEDNRVILGQNPWGSFNPKMTVLSFSDEGGNPVANLIHYGCHGTAAGVNHEITRDWMGVMIDMLEEESGAITAFFNGPEGDVGPRLANGKTTGDSHVRYAVELGGVAGADAVRIYESSDPYRDAALTVSTKEISIPLLPRISREEAERELEKYKSCTVNLNARKRRFYERTLASYEEEYVEETCVTFPQTIIWLGDVALVSFPYEVFSEIGMRTSKSSPIPHTLSIANANGASGYFVTQDQLCRGGYEVDMFLTRPVQRFVDNADHHLITQTLTHLRSLKGE